MTVTTRRSLTSRPLDLLYFVFFIFHIPNTILVDVQAIYPKEFVPSVLAQLPKLYVELSGDPLIGGANGFFGNAVEDSYIWFKSFLLLEIFFQLPVFILGIRGLWRDTRSPTLYLLLLAYGASTSTTLLPCLSIFFSTPTTTAETLKQGVIAITSFQRMLLFASYVPFLLVPLGMTIDMALRLEKLARKGKEIEEKMKSE
ncbi:transmembrane protein 6/97 [Abortiporus biennis]|nr:transmembrane protein 6/97 [Abortiporus biennis]